MQKIEYRVVYSTTYSDGVAVNPELIRVDARDINSGFAKALRRAKEPLGNGVVRDIYSIEFWAVIG